MADSWGDAYAKYRQQLQSGDVNADFIKNLYEPLKGTRSEEWDDFADRIINIHKELAAQQQLKTESGKTLGEMWYGGDIGKDDATWDMAFRLAESGVDSLYDIGQRQVETTDGEGGYLTESVLFDKRTGEPLNMPRMSSGTFDLDYELQFTPNGMPIAYTGNKTSDWVDFRDQAKMIASTIGMMTPAAPYIAAANAANFASKGEWDKAILAALPAAGSIAGQFGASASTVAGINEANKFAKILKSLEDKKLLPLAFQGADLAGISEIAGFDINDVKKAVNLGMAAKNADKDPAALFRAGASYLPKDVYGFDPSKLEEGKFRYNQVFDPATAGLVDLSEQPIEGYEFTKDFTPGASLDLFPTQQNLGLKAPPVETEVFRPDGSVNYDIFDFEGYQTGEGLRMPTDRNLAEIGGGQGITVGEGAKPAFDLGDPSSFINQPAPGGDVSDAVQKALDAGAKETLKDVTKAGTQKTGAGGMDLSGLLSLLGGQQASPYLLSVPENAADIELMEDIFGTSLSAPSTGTDQDRAAELARLLRS